MQWITAERPKNRKNLTHFLKQIECFHYTPNFCVTILKCLQLQTLSFKPNNKEKFKMHWLRKSLTLSEIIITYEY